MKNYIKLGYIQSTINFFNNPRRIRFYYSTDKKLKMDKVYIKNITLTSYGIFANVPKIKIIKQKKTYCEFLITSKWYKLIFNIIGNVYFEIWGKVN